METTYIGFAAGVITSLAALPQLVRTYRTKHARDISIWQPLLLVIGMLLWVIYGFALEDVPLIAANLFSLICYTLLIIMKICFRDDDIAQGNDYNVRNNASKEDL
jgi:MtN3 and saliva related transmembrane protein